MIKTKKLSLARETLVLLSTRELRDVGGGGSRQSAFPNKCEPSGIIACPTA
jgi:hypothetical protein